MTDLAAGTGAGRGSSQADRTGLTESGGWPGGYAPPVMTYHLVFHGEVSCVRATSSEPSHLIEPMPTQPGSTKRSG